MLYLFLEHDSINSNICNYSLSIVVVVLKLSLQVVEELVVVDDEVLIGQDQVPLVVLMILYLTMKKNLEPHRYKLIF